MRNPKRSDPEDPAGVIFEIERFAIHDGPGIRTLVFFKGCPLLCKWCCNPESQNPAPELGYRKTKCMGFQACVRVCPEVALEFSPGTGLSIDRKRCTVCGKCVKACSAEALVLFGRIMRVSEVMAKIERDKPFYERSGGGVTISGGEPTMQLEFLLALLRRLKESSIHTTIETCGYVNGRNLRKIIPYVDLFLLDIKHMDDKKHWEGTGVSIKLILQNARRIAQAGVPLTIRVPVIPRYNDSLDNIKKIIEFTSSLPSLQGIDFLPYHRLGRSKYEMLGQEYKLTEEEPPGREVLNGFRELAVSYGIPASVGGLD